MVSYGSKQPSSLRQDCCSAMCEQTRLKDLLNRQLHAHVDQGHLTALPLRRQIVLYTGKAVIPV